MWIKICGITRTEDAEIAIAAGADALGFVFAQSSRQVTPEIARRIISRLPESIEKIGVFVDTPWNDAISVAANAGLTGVQRHTSGYAFLAFDLPSNTPAQLRIIHVLRHDGNAARFDADLRRAASTGMETVLVDSCVRGLQGGTGQPFDWNAARADFLQQGTRLQMIAAGGLRPENIADAIHTLRPWGVDVSSGVEASPGKKDAERVRTFIRQARQAGAVHNDSLQSQTGPE